MMRPPEVSPAQLALGTLTALLLFGSAPVMGHSLLVVPQPRDQQDGYKDPPRAPPGTGAPCGVMRSATQPQTTFAAGQPLHVQWSETITHPGCFVIDFATANDATFQILGVKSHSTAAGNTPRPWSLDVVLPSAPCAACTLRLRQLMLAADVPETQCPPATIPLGSTYYSCSNVTLTGTGTGTADGGTPDARPDAGGSAGRAGGVARDGTGGTPGSSGGAPGGTGTGGAAASSGGSTVAITVMGTGGTTASGSGASATGSGGANGGSSASATTGGSNPSSSSQNSGGGCSVSGAPSSESIVSIASALCLAGAFIGKRRRPADPKTKERLQ